MKVFQEPANKDVDPALLPPTINITYYNNHVVNPSTNQVYPGKPWMIMAYWKKCGFCVKFKPEFEEMALKNPDIANWAYVDGVDEEYLRITYNFTSFPWIFMLKGDSMYPYSGMRNEEKIVEFITTTYNETATKAPIPPTLTYLGLQYIYL